MTLQPYGTLKKERCPRICPQDGTVCWDLGCDVAFCEEQADAARRPKNRYPDAVKVLPLPR